MEAISLYPLAIGFSGLGVGIGLGYAVGKALEAVSRQPEAISKIQTLMIIGAAFIEAIMIYALISIYFQK